MRYLVNHDGACDFGEVSDPNEIEAYKVLSEESTQRTEKEEISPRTFKQFRDKMQGNKPKNGFRKMKANLGKTGDRKQFSKKDRPVWGKSKELV